MGTDLEKGETRALENYFLSNGNVIVKKDLFSAMSAARRKSPVIRMVSGNTVLRRGGDCKRGRSLA